MCCFSGPPGIVKYVAQTNIFARARGPGRQVLVYSMNVEADEPVAMILPLPVPPRTGEDGVGFIDLSGYPRFFRDLEAGFPRMMMMSFGKKSRSSGRGGAVVPMLEVHKVGKFEASFVPTLADFSRLDARFQIAPSVWDALPAYRDHGFAVFKLVDLRRTFFRRRRTIHPMAFEFPVRDAGALFFPTLHIHDGEVHPRARFDHTLYFQGARRPARGGPFDATSTAPAARFMDLDRAKGVLDGDAVVERVQLGGELVNEDTLVRAA